MEYSFISGATGGIGKAFATELAKNNENLILTGRSQEKLDDLKKQLLDLNGNINILTYLCQLTDEKDRKRMTDSIINGGYGIKRIVNVAGADIQKGFTDYTDEKVIFQIRVNVEATISLTHDLLPLMTDGGEILTVSSMSGVTPMPYFALYSATKQCLVCFFTALRLELKERGIKVTTVLPGGVYTRPDIIENIKLQGLWGKLSSKTPKYVAKTSLKAVKKNKSTFIPGGFNRFLYVVMKLIPKAITMRYIKNRWKKQTKDAF